MKPKCPRCGEPVVVSLPTFLMADNSRPPATAAAVKPLK
jgi:hypothetical protein